MKVMLVFCLFLSSYALYGQNALKVYVQGGKPTIWQCGRNGYRQASFKWVDVNAAELTLQGQGMEGLNVLKMAARGNERVTKRKLKAFYYAIKQIEKTQSIEGNGRKTLHFYKKGFHVQVNITWSEGVDGYILDMKC